MRTVFARLARNGTALAFLALVALGVGVAVAAIPSGDGTITGCFTNRGGQLRVIDAATTAGCAKGETALTWNQGPRASAFIDADGTLGAGSSGVAVVNPQRDAANNIISLCVGLKFAATSLVVTQAATNTPGGIVPIGLSMWVIHNPTECAPGQWGIYAATANGQRSTPMYIMAN